MGGQLIVHLRQHFPDAEIVGVDVSGKSLDVARARFGNLADFTHFNGATLPFPSHRFDVAFSACVFHHISVAEHATALGNTAHTARARTIAIFEHNPSTPDGSCGQDLP